MPIAETSLPDGNSSWNMGMDSSKHPSEVGKAGYYKGINVYIPRTGGGIKNRGGFHYQHIDWSSSPSGKSIYEQGHIQGEGWYYDGSEEVLLRSVSGYIIELRQVTEGLWRGYLYESFKNNSNSTKAWFTRIPYGCIVNNGIDLPIIITRDDVRRSNPSIGEITTGRMGVYVQNRFFYVDPTGVFIQASDFRNPVSILESSTTNIHGFLNPNDENEITAIGHQKIILDSALAGALSWSDGHSIFSADVRKSRETWEELSLNIGKIQQSIPSIGAASSYSYENFNTNLYFRSSDYGLCDFRQSQYQFVRESDFESQSVEVDNWFGNDTKWMLDQCYTRRFGNRLYTTTGGAISETGYVYWNGLVVAHPNPSDANLQEDFPRRFEGMLTGIRPWCITVTEPPVFNNQMLIDSYDPDGINRLYKYVESSDYDLSHRGDRIEIESSIHTRAYDGGARNEPKTTLVRFYSIGGLKRDINVQVSSRSEGYGEYRKQFDITHRIKNCCNTYSSITGDPCFRPMPIKPQERKRVLIDAEAENSKDNPDYGGGIAYNTRQYLFQIKGPFILYQFILVAVLVNWDKTIKKQSDEDRLLNPYVHVGVDEFSYNISTGNNNPFIKGWNHDTDEKPS